MNICIQNRCLDNHFPINELYRQVAAAGFSSVDLNLGEGISKSDAFLHHRNEGLIIFEKDLPDIMAFFKADIDAIKEAGLSVHQAHAPFPACVPEEDPSMLDDSIEIYKKCILLCQEIGCRKLVIHGINYKKENAAHSREWIDRLNEKLYTSLIDTLKQTDVMVCLENLFYMDSGKILMGNCADAREAVRQIDRYNEIAGKECFGLCCDTGHLNLLGINPYDYITTLGKRIKAFHIHDNDGKIDLHLAPYTGTIDWESFCCGVKEVAYDDDISFETFSQYKIERIADARAVKLWIRFIGEIGNLFKEKITEH